MDVRRKAVTAMDTVREMLEARERETLASGAALAADAARDRAEPPCPYRTAYQRDRDRVLHCKAFRRLKDKTQVFLSPEGDHYRTRLTHTLEVSQIARTVARALRLNEDLTEAVALAHDLGHTPFGHAGERALDKLMDGGFHHYEQSVRVVELLEPGSARRGGGLNLTAAVRDGILRHTGGAEAATLEGRVVRLADRVAYVNHDIDDAIRAGVLAEDAIPADIRDCLGGSRSARIARLVAAAVTGSDAECGRIALEPDAAAAFKRLHSFMFEAVYTNPLAKSEEEKVDGFIERLFTWFCAHPDSLPAEFAAIREAEGVRRAVCDYIAGMTDGYALDTHERLFVPRAWQGQGQEIKVKSGRGG